MQSPDPAEGKWVVLLPRLHHPHTGPAPESWPPQAGTKKTGAPSSVSIDRSLFSLWERG
jgi:hypothetical protein